MRHYRYPASAAVGVLFVLLTSLGFGRGANGQPPGKTQELSPKVLAFLQPIAASAGDNDLQKKLKERHNSAVALLDARVKEYKKGLRDVQTVFQAATMVVDSKMDLANAPAAKIAILDQALAVAILFEQNLQQQIDRGFGSKGDLEQARFARLTVEVELLKAQQKGSPVPKR